MIYSDSAKRLFNSQPDRFYRLAFFRLYHANGFEARFYNGSTAYPAVLFGNTYQPNNVTANPIGGTIDKDSSAKTTIRLGIDCAFIQEFLADVTSGANKLLPLFCDYSVVSIAGRPPLENELYNLDSFAGTIDFIRQDNGLSVQSIKAKANQGYTLSLSPPQLNKRTEADLYVGKSKFSGIIF